VARRSPLLAIFLIVLVDVLGFTIVIPLLAFYAERFGASPLVATSLVSVYAVCSLCSTPIIGNLSDRYGRRPLLLLSQAGTCAGFLMLAYSNALWMVFVGRILDGITAGNLALAQAYISDHTKPEDRAKAFGVIGVAFGIGFSFGPGLGGVLSKRYGVHVPFILAASLSMLSMIATYTLLRENAATDLHATAKRPSPFAIRTYLAYFRRPGLGTLYLQFFLFAFAFSCFTSNLALFSERRFTIGHDVARIEHSCQIEAKDTLELPGAKRGHLYIGDAPQLYGLDWTIKDERTIALTPWACARLDATPAPRLRGVFPWGAREVGLLLVAAGVFGIILQGGLIGRLVKKYGERRLVVMGFASAAIAYVALGFAFSIVLLLTVALVNAFGNGVIRPSITAQITHVAGRAEQGVAIGISGSLSSFAMMLAPLAGGVLMDREWVVAWTLLIGTVAFIGLLVANHWRKQAATLSSAA
jgi:MFS family permease